MINCAKCKNKEICKFTEQADELNKDIQKLEIKYKNLYGRIVADCNYFTVEELLKSF